MKVIRTFLTDSEHKLLEDYAARNSKTIKEVVKEAIRKTVIPDRIIPRDPLFQEPPSSKKMGRKDDASLKHDEYLYGDRRNRAR